MLLKHSCRQSRARKKNSSSDDARWGVVDAGLLRAPISPNCWVRFDRRFKTMLLRAVQERVGGNVPWSSALHHLKGKWHLQTMVQKYVGACAVFPASARSRQLDCNVFPPRNVTAFNLSPESSLRLLHLHLKLLADALIVTDAPGVRTHAVLMGDSSAVPEQKLSPRMHWFHDYSDPFANKDLHIMWNNLSLIRTTVALPRGQHYQLFRPEYRGWIWKLIPCTSIWPILSQHQGQSSPKSRGPRRHA